MYLRISFSRKRHGLSQHPVPIRQIPSWPSTGFRLVMNDMAHVERSHNILVPYCHMVEKSTLANAHEVHGPRQRLIFKGTVGVIIAAMGTYSVTNYKQFELPTKVVRNCLERCEYCSESSSLCRIVSM